LWVAGGSGTNTLAWSSDGTTWTGLGTTIFSAGCNSLASRRPLPYIGYSYAKASGSGGLDTAYTPYDSALWDGTPPSTLAQAIDRLAQAVSGQLGTAIPQLSLPEVIDI